MTSALPPKEGTLDDGYTLVPLGRNFTYFGDMYDEIYISTNGFASFGNGTHCPDCNSFPDASGLNITRLPSTKTPTNVLAPFWTDLDFDPAPNATLSYKRYYIVMEDRFIIQWKNAPQNQAENTTANSFQIVGDFNTECIFYRYGFLDIDINRTVVVGYSDKTGMLPEAQDASMFNPTDVLSGEKKCYEFCPELPSQSPSSAPSRVPSPTPSDIPSNLPSQSPSDEPSVTPSDEPSGMPSQSPSALPSSEPSLLPSSSPSSAPSSEPSYVPSVSLEPSESPSLEPSSSPSRKPSLAPSSAPSESPSDMPSESPSEQPSKVPSSSPSDEPSFSPTLCYARGFPNPLDCTGTIGNEGGGGDYPCCFGLICCNGGTFQKCALPEEQDSCISIIGGPGP